VSEENITHKTYLKGIKVSVKKRRKDGKKERRKIQKEGTRLIKHRKFRRGGLRLRRKNLEPI
jgi:hypothetical protein